MNDHPASVMVVKSALVDIKIQSVVNWLNSFESVTTRWSCEGDLNADNEYNAKPMIVFYCESNLELATILKATDIFAKCEVVWYEPQGSIRYILWFHDIADLVKLKEKLEQK